MPFIPFPLIMRRGNIEIGEVKPLFGSYFMYVSLMEGLRNFRKGAGEHADRQSGITAVCLVSSYEV